MKKIFTLLTLALISIGSAWGEDAVSATQTFSADRKTCTWTDMSVAVAKNGTAGDFISKQVVVVLFLHRVA